MEVLRFIIREIKKNDIRRYKKFQSQKLGHEKSVAARVNWCCHAILKCQFLMFAGSNDALALVGTPVALDQPQEVNQKVQPDGPSINSMVHVSSDCM